MDVPSLLVFGDNGVASSIMAEEIQHLNSIFQVKQISEAGHSLQLDQPDRFLTVVKTFLDAIPIRQ